jgi:hypothetical protein
VLLKRFLDSTSTAEEDPYEHAALVLTNITRLPEGRKLLLEPGRDALRALAGQLGSRSRLRRSGCATLIRNCCFRAEVCCADACSPSNAAFMSLVGRLQALVLKWQQHALSHN